MKKLFNAFILLGSFSALAVQCEVGPKAKKIDVSKTGNYSLREGGYSYLIKYDAKEEYLSLIIEGGPLDLRAETEGYGARKSYLTLGNKGEFSDVTIYCD